jgi:hypothetical protein
VTQAVAERLCVDVVAGHRFVFAPVGRGEELRLHLAAHGIQPVNQRPEGVAFDRLELAGDVDPDAVQAVLDGWAR